MDTDFKGISNEGLAELIKEIHNEQKIMRGEMKPIIEIYNALLGTGKTGKFIGKYILAPLTIMCTFILTVYGVLKLFIHSSPN